MTRSGLPAARGRPGPRARRRAACNLNFKLNFKSFTGKFKFTLSAGRLVLVLLYFYSGCSTTVITVLEQ